MAPTPLPPDAGGDDRQLELLQDPQRGNGEGNAAPPVERVTADTLQEALAAARADGVVDAEPRLADRIEAVAADFATGPLVPRLDVPASARRQMPTRELPVACSPMPMPPALEMEIALAVPTAVAASPAITEPEVAAAQAPALRPTEDWQGFADAPATPPQPPPSPDPPPAQNVEPLTSALDAAVRLAADANAAAEALENLKRLLERRRPDPALPPAADHTPAPPHAEVAALSPTAAKPPPLPLPPLPLIPLHPPRKAGHGITPRTAALPPPPRRAQAERRRFDMRGFLAGFALSWAFGVVLYLFLTAG